MNYQRINPNTLSKASRILECLPANILYYAWPQSFSSTTGPFAGFGGPAFRVFIIEAYTDGRDAVLMCNDKYWKKVEQFDPREAVIGKYR